MRRDEKAPELMAVVNAVRALRGWSHSDLARAAGMHKPQLREYEAGRSAPTRPSLARLLAALGLTLAEAERLLPSVRLIQATAARKGAETGAPESAQEIAAEVARAAAPLVQGAIAGELASDPLFLTRTAEVACPPSPDDRLIAAELWARLKHHSAHERRVLVEGAREYQSWALCELLCAESETAAADDPRRARQLADLALQVAALVPGEESWRSLVQAYALAHQGNAHRVRNNLASADAAFARSRELWRAGASAAPGPLDQGRLLDLEASLRRAQRRFREALRLHDQALALTAPQDAGSVLLNKAGTLEQAGEHERAIETLRQAAPRLDRERQPRLAFALLFNLAVDLCHAGRHGEAEPMLAEIRALAERLGNDLDLLRLRWLEARIAAGLGRREEALSALGEVRAGFVARSMAYDAALATLEIAVVLAEQGQAREVKELAREMRPIFAAQGVHREALAALKLFCEAAEREAVTVGLARRVADFLERARQDGRVRFEHGP